MRKSTLTLVLAAAVAAAVPAAGLLAGEPDDPPAAESVREKVERIFPDLSADRDAVRERAELELFALGDQGRRELERISRDPDPKRAITALRLLGREGWKRTRPGEERARRDEPGAPEAVPPSLRQWEADLERRMADMRRRFEEMHRRLREDFPEWPNALEFGIEDGGQPGTTSSGRVVTNDRSLAWSIDEKGRVKVTTKDGKDAAEATVEAESMDALRKDHPDLAKRLDEVSPRSGVRRWTLRLPRDARDWNPWAAEPRPETPGTTPKTQPAPGELLAVRPALGIEWQPVPELLREHLDLDEGGLVVERVLPGTLAERLGLRRHDVLVAIGGAEVADDAAVRTAVEAVKPGDEVGVTIVRKGARQNLSAKR